MSDQRGQIENQNMDQMEQPVSDRQQAGNESNNGRSSGRSNRGFAAMSPERQKQIASEGGRAAHRQGVAHEWNSDEARKAGRKGGEIVSRNREHMSEIGRRGGQSSGGRRSKKNQEPDDSNE
jgi:uncharacterized protein